MKLHRSDLADLAEKLKLLKQDGGGPIYFIHSVFVLRVSQFVKSNSLLPHHFQRWNLHCWVDKLIFKNLGHQT